ncbi:MAG: DUF58 domain-containing protein [Phycisphaerales bacterium]|nr:DUF58 domain-containing protein [Phycisphaerales bacterium]
MTEATDILAVPHELTAREFELAARRLADDLTYGMDASRFVGSGIDYAQSRGFVYGDSVRDIDWRVTARTGRVHVKEYESTKRVPVFIVADTSGSMAHASTRLSKHDLAVWIGAVLALVAIHRRSPVAVLSGGDRQIPIAPTMSRGAVWRQVESLRSPGLTEVTRLAAAADRIDALAPHTSLVFVISDLHSPDAETSIKRLGQRHDCVVLQLRDPSEGRRLRGGFLRASEAETGVAFVAGSGTIVRGVGHNPVQFSASGVDHVVLSTNGPILAPLRRIISVHARGWRAAR